MLVRQAHSFGQLYRARNLERLAQSQADEVRPGALGGVADQSAGAGLVPYKTTSIEDFSEINQDGVIMGSWPTISDFPPLLMPMPENAASASVSALTPSSALPLMATCAPIQGKPMHLASPETVPAKPDLALLALTATPQRLANLLPDLRLNPSLLGNRWPLPSSPKPKGVTSRRVNGRRAKASPSPSSQTAGGAA